ncbi:hypothetical protein NHJ13734_004658 [Beauveria thailandica]
MVALTFRRATADDAPRLRDLMEHAFSTKDSRPNWTGDEELASNYTLKLESMQAALAMDGVVTFAVLNEAGDIIASANVGKKGDDTGRIGGLIVQDGYQRGGVGGQVLTYAEESREYRETGQKSAFPRDDDRFASCTIPEDLCFVEMSKDLYAGKSAEKLQEK